MPLDLWSEKVELLAWLTLHESYKSGCILCVLPTAAAQAQLLVQDGH